MLSQSEFALEKSDQLTTDALKTKREKFNVDIRKQKNQDIFNKKRFRFSGLSGEEKELSSLESGEKSMESNGELMVTLLQIWLFVEEKNKIKK